MRLAMAEKMKTPQLQSGGPSVVREQMFAAFASIDRALSLLIKFLIAVKTLIEVLKSLNNYM
ncbi:hypothetical protein CF112_19550 [Aeromonas hydrophila]|nr:hypothetical protein CF112_19550 [Aeromonas hydrophila]